MWDSDEKTWARWLESYQSALETQSELPRKSGLQDLDRFVWSELPASLKEQGHITSAEYVRLVQWKLKRGKWRPRLQGFADALKESDITHASEQAINHLKDGNIKAALAPLVALRGCGPATASALLAAADDTVPFMSDELLAATHGKDSKKYTVPVYMQMVQRAREKATNLTNESNARHWTARDVERAVFAAEHCTEPVTSSTRTVRSPKPKDTTSPQSASAVSKSRKRTRGSVEDPAISKDDDTKTSKAPRATVVEDAEIDKPSDHSTKPARKSADKQKGKVPKHTQKTPLRRSKRKPGT